MNDKLSQLPEPVQKELLHNKLNVYDICETLRNNPDLLTDTVRLDNNMAVRRFNPFKPLFVFQYTFHTICLVQLRPNKLESNEWNSTSWTA